jgi:hypothetical protein
MVTPLTLTDRKKALAKTVAFISGYVGSADPHDAAPCSDADAPDRQVRSRLPRDLFNAVNFGVWNCDFAGKLVHVFDSAAKAR